MAKREIGKCTECTKTIYASDDYEHIETPLIDKWTGKKISILVHRKCLIPAINKIFSRVKEELDSIDYLEKLILKKEDSKIGSK